MVDLRIIAKVIPSVRAVSGLTLVLALMACGGGAAGESAPTEDPFALVSCPQAATALAGQSVSLACQAGTSSVSPTIDWALLSAPVGFSFSPRLGSGVEFIASSPGEYRFQVTSSVGETKAFKTVAVTVAPVPNLAPVISCPVEVAARVGEEQTIRCTVSDDGLPTGTTLLKRWTSTSGPNKPALVDADAAEVRWLPTTAGRYSLHLVVDDGQLASAADVVVVVEPALNRPPVVTCPSTLGGTAGAVVDMVCTVADDSLPAGSSLTSEWTPLSAPTAVTLSRADAAATQFVPPIAGSYQFRLSVTDGAVTSRADVTVNVNPPPNAPPSITCPPTLTATVGLAKSLTCQAADDGLPSGSALRSTWTVVNAPAPITLSGNNTLTPSFIPTVAGSYRLRLTVSDGTLASVADVVVTASLPPNAAPTVVCPPVLGVAGTRVSVACTATDDGQPAGAALQYTWSVISAPTAPTVTGQNTPAASFVPAGAGTYRLRLVVSDGALSGTADVSVVVNLPPNVAPTVSCPPSRPAVAGQATTITCTATDDGQPANVTLRPTWTVQSAPATVSLINPTTLVGSFIPPVAGTYRLQLAVSDSLLATTAQVVVSASPPPNQAPTVSCPSTASGRVGRPLSVECTAADDGLPAGSSLALGWTVAASPVVPALSGQSSRVVSFTPAAAGDYRLRLTASDGSLSTTADVTVSVVTPATVRVLPLGDSITNGWGAQQSYRYALWKKVLDAGGSTDFIGTLNSVDGGNPVWPDHLGRNFDRDHEGHSGWTAGQIAGSLPSWLAAYFPDLGLIQLGTNDGIGSGADGVTSALNGLSANVQRLRERNPDVKIFVAKLIPIDTEHPGWTGGPGRSALSGHVTTLNGRLDAWAAALTTARSPIRVVDQSAGFNARTDTFDGLHPNAGGEEKMAQRWWDAIRGDF